MPLLLPEPEVQFCDANGHPFAGGTVTFYTPGTDTLKDTWQDHDGTSLNTNPVILDAAGRAIIFGSGEYRCVLKDADGNLIYDQWTSSVVSDVMLPVVQATSIAEARDLLGITDAIQTETDRALAAEANLQNAITAETTRATNAENTLTTDLNNEIARAEAAEASLQSQINGLGTQKMLVGGGATDSSGYARVTFSTAFTYTPCFVACIAGNNFDSVCINVYPDNTGADIRTDFSDTPFGPAGFQWIAVGT